MWDAIWAVAAALLVHAAGSAKYGLGFDAFGGRSGRRSRARSDGVVYAATSMHLQAPTCARRVGGRGCEGPIPARSRTELHSLRSMAEPVKTAFGKCQLLDEFEQTKQVLAVMYQAICAHLSTNTRRDTCL